MYWAWGLAGAFAYAGPLLSASWTQASKSEPKGSRLMCLWEFAVALGIGAIFAAAFTPLIAGVLGRSDPKELHGIATLIGLCANGAAPKVIDVVNGRLLKTLKGSKS